MIHFCLQQTINDDKKVPLSYLFTDHFGQLVRVHRVDLVHVELETELPTPVAAAVTVDGEAHGVENVLHLFHPRLLEDRPDGYLDPAGGGAQDRRGKEHQNDHVSKIYFFTVNISQV